MKVSFLTLGCRVNQSETITLEETLKENGISIVTLNEKPDYCVINTCSVTAKGDYNSRQLIRRAAKSGAKVIVTGCYSQLSPDRVRSMEGVYKVVDNSRKLEIVDMIAARYVDICYSSSSHSRPYLKIQDGCNYRCSYCTVPMARGKSRSVSMDKVVERIRLIESRGYNEVVLTGIHIGTYGRDLNPASDLKGLLRHILKETRIKRIRLSSLEISEIDEEMTEILSDERICKHLHLPLQSGSERILKLMRRGYRAAYFTEMVESISLRIRNISIGTDIIVGFPGESDQDYKATYDLLKGLPISYMHIFPFSARPGTDASMMTERVEELTLKRRARAMADLNKLKKRSYMERQINDSLDIILEESDGAGVYTGTSGNYLKIRASARGYGKGSILYVRPVSICEGMLDAVPIL